MQTIATHPESWSAQEVEDLLILARFVSNGKRAMRQDKQGRQAQAATADALACRRLTERCALVPKPRAAGGHVASLIGISRLYRFVHTPVGNTEGMPVDREVEVRRNLLDALNLPDRQTVEARMCSELVEIRAGIFRCAHADLCAGRGCPFELEVSADAVDRALSSLLPRGN